MQWVTAAATLVALAVCVGSVTEGDEQRFDPDDSVTAVSLATGVQHCCGFDCRIWWLCVCGTGLVVTSGPLRRLRP